MQKDAPHPHTNAVYLPVTTRPPAVTPAAVCQRVPRGNACAALVKAGRDYLAALSVASAYAQASAVAIDRYGGGIKQADTRGMLTQQAAAYVYLADYADATKRLRQAGRKLGALLRADGLDVILSAQQVEALRNTVLQLKDVPPAALAELRAQGIAPTPADVTAALSAAFAAAGPPQPIRLSDVLGTKPQLGGLVTEADRLTPLHLAAIADTLAGQHLISRRTHTVLHRNAVSIETACTAANRGRAARRFIASVKQATRGQIRALLSQAGQFVAGFHKGLSAPLAPCHKR